MVNPLYLIAVFLMGAFLVPFVDKTDRRFSLFVFFATLIYTVAAGCIRLWQLLYLGAIEQQIFTAGFAPPLSIALSFGFKEAFLVSLVNFSGLLTGLYMVKKLKESGIQSISLLLLVLLGANGLILTRDIFNGFVFLEILSIATYAIIGITQNKNALSSGFKYMMAGGLASSFLLLGIAFGYKYSGTLNLDVWSHLVIPMTAGYKIALFLIIMAIVIELKPFPANGWALDIYQSVHSGVASLIASVNTGALLYFFYKLLPLMPVQILNLVAFAGLVSFLMSNLTALRQKNAGRLLGYSSTAQSGLLIFVLAGLSSYNVPKDIALLIAAGLFVTNFIAKPGLFWIAGIIKEEAIEKWNVLRNHPYLLALFGVFTLALTGLPPFPAFYAKWDLVRMLIAQKGWMPLVTILLGSLLEAVYLMRWLGYATSSETETEASAKIPFIKLISPFAGALLLLALSLFVGTKIYYLSDFMLLPFIVLLAFNAIDFMPVKLKGFILLAVVGIWGWVTVWPQMIGIGKLFSLVFLAGSAVQVFGFMRYRGAKPGQIPLIASLIFALGNLLLASTKLDFFISWEFMTLTSYLLIMRGKNARKGALAYMIFSLGGAYLILTGLNLLPSFIPGTAFYLQSAFQNISLVAAILLGVGFLIKIGALGVHVWLPEAYAEAEDEFTSLLSSVLSKAGIFGLMLTLLMARQALAANGILLDALSWLGVLTAFFGALMAVFQEDVKKLLAYSSMSQLGYIIVGFALMSHLGWVSGMYLTMTHLFFKAMIFMAIAGVILRTGTRNMYEMGGLIKKMPISYISVLMGIIAVSGVPPLSGFGSKWFIYVSLIEQGHYFQAGLAFFASAVAFLYLYKLIHTVFLGQPKPSQKDVKEAPIWLLIPQVFFIMVIMGISMFPNLITKPISSVVGMFIPKPEWLTWTGYNITLNAAAIHGNWNGNLVMFVTMGVFGIPLVWLLLVNAKAQKVKQFNIVFAAERPYKPWTTHFAHNMFAHYNKALGWLVTPRITAFWNCVSEWAHSVAAMFANLYTGNGQTYLLHIFMYVLVIYIVGGIR